MLMLSVYNVTDNIWDGRKYSKQNINFRQFLHKFDLDVWQLSHKLEKRNKKETKFVSQF